MGLFGKEAKKDPKDQVREWTSALRKEGRQLDRQIRSIEVAEAKVKRSIKDSAKKNHMDVCKILAKELIQSKKAKNRIYTSKAHLNSVGMQMKNQQALLRVSGALEKSTVVMKAMQSLVKVPEIQATMMELSKEMMKAGIIEEMMEDTFESLDDVEEDATQEEIDKILYELTAGALSTAPEVSAELPGPAEGATAGPESEEEEEEGDDLQAMQARLEALRS
ncbi:charged multivesicular body protein 3 [Strongylocentrotus purpuratus]|uniref:Charged multivesicular body protein 3 n=1 Tax=Strongylocentrotus purpuratus TaxID=7668 RepID=A0A7M7HGP7_STRPU|nr:charged multivesicular body protein 3 [Strongylocentrotus purpuratus]|eukprot:XP_011674707.1 PREDICTED: charged multivesicular body protein 3 isoform X2 [Strongylocentrotus purpuratus]